MSQSLVMYKGGKSTIAAQAVDTTSTPNLLVTLQNPGSLGIITVTGIVTGTGPLTGLKISTAANLGGTHVDRLVNTDFNSANRLLPFSTSNPQTTATGNSFQFELDMTGVAEIKIYVTAQTNGANVAFEISA